MTTIWREIAVYLLHCLAIFRPGATPPLFQEPSTYDGSLAEMEKDHLDLVIEEGRRQLDRQIADLERIRSRSAVLVTVGIAEIGVLTAGAKQVFETGVWTFSLWVFSSLAVVLGLFGAAAVLTASAHFGRIETRMVAELSEPIRYKLAEGYADSTGLGECTVATRLTVFRSAVMLLIIGAIIYACAWGIAR